MRNKGFTLAEVLITLVVIGVVAAITVPMFIHQEGDRVNSERHANIVYKIAQATDMMKAHGNLGNFSTTDEFVDELQKYLKINKRCDSNHLQECWPTHKVKNMAGEEVEIANVKTRADLGFDDDYANTNNVGLILADGANIILTYNPAFEGITQSEAIVHTPGLLPVGEGREEFLNYTSNTMSGLAFVFDINGNKGPNTETENGTRDIRSFNGAKFGEAKTNPCSKWNYDKKLVVNGKCYFELPSTYNWYTAKTACPSDSRQVGSGWRELYDACLAIKAQNKTNGIGDNTNPFTQSYFWAASIGDHNDGNWVIFTNCAAGGSYSGGNFNNLYYVLCMGN